MSGLPENIPPMDHTELGTQKFKDFLEGQQQFIYTGFQTLLIQNLGEFQNFARFCMVFLEFRSKFTKFGGILGISFRLTEHLLQVFQCRPWRLPPPQARNTFSIFCATATTESDNHISSTSLHIQVYPCHHVVECRSK